MEYVLHGELNEFILTHDVRCSVLACTIYKRVLIYWLVVVHSLTVLTKANNHSTNIFSDIKRFYYFIDQLMIVGWLASEAVVFSRYCLWYELSTFTAAASYTQWPQEQKHTYRRQTCGQGESLFSVLSLVPFLQNMMTGVTNGLLIKLASVMFLSRVGILLLTRDIDIVILSVCPSVCLSVRDTLVLYENGLTYRHSFSTIR